jgi:hypothetical protein
MLPHWGDWNDVVYMEKKICETDKPSQENKVIIEISMVRGKPAVPWALTFSVSAWNSIDTVDDFMNNNSEDIPGYVERDALGKVLVLARNYLGSILSASDLVNVDLRMEKTEEVEE